MCSKQVGFFLNKIIHMQIKLIFQEHQKQQCEVFMIEQGFSIATSNGGTSQATIHIPSTLSVDGQHITIDGQQITVEQVIPGQTSVFYCYFFQQGVFCVFIYWGGIKFYSCPSPSVTHLVSAQLNLSSSLANILKLKYTRSWPVK